MPLEGGMKRVEPLPKAHTPPQMGKFGFGFLINTILLNFQCFSMKGAR